MMDDSNEPPGPNVSADAGNAGEDYNAVIAVIRLDRSFAMATLTIRNFDDSLKARLRVRAASRGRSMEDEVRQILRSALSEPTPATGDLGSRIRRRFAALGGVDLPIAPREPVRDLSAALDASPPGSTVSRRRRATDRAPR